MSLHPLVVGELLDTEMEVAQQRLGDRISGLERVGPIVYCRLEETNVGPATLALDGTSYDGEPFKVTVVDAARQPASQEAWPGNLCHGMHPVLNRLFVCVRGAYEYHCLPQHAGDTWDAHRSQLRLPRLLDHLVRRAGR